MQIKEEAIEESLRYRLLNMNLRNIRKTYVGTCIYTGDRVIGGFNIENRCHKGLHAEELTVINCIQYGVDQVY